MNRTLIVAAALLASPAAAQELNLRQVTLSASGVAQYEFQAALDGPARLHLDVPLDQVSDVLKSLRVSNPGGGLPAVSLPGRQPLSEAFRTLPFGREALESTQALLGALIGAEVRIPITGMTGRILAVASFTVKLPDGGGTVTRHRLTIATDSGLDMAVLEALAAVEFTDATLRGQIGRALAAVAANSAQDRRRLEMSVPGEGKRDLRLSYVVPAPSWKLSYRLVLPGGPDLKEGARLQAFAVTENLSGQDWRDVALVLTSGQPVLYQQALYDPVQPSRPEAPVDVPGRPSPRLDEGGVPRPVLAPPPPPPPPGMGSADAMRRRAPPSGAALAAPRSAAASPYMSERSGTATLEPAPEPAQTAQAATQVEFRLASPVTAPSGQSLLLPVIDRTVAGRRVALYQPSTDRLHPLVALELRNDTGAALPAGLAALFDADGVFIGDARLPTIQKEETRLASFAVDLAVRIDRSTSQDVRFVSAKATRGVLEVQRRERSTTTYRIDNGADAARTVLIEQPQRRGWTLAQPENALKTPTDWRIAKDVAAGGTETLQVILERPLSEAIVLLDQEPDRLLALAAGGELSPRLRDALRRAASLRAEVQRREEAVSEAESRIDSIAQDQGRVRENLKAVPANSELQRNYLRQMQSQETELATLREGLAASRRAVREAEVALRDYLGSLQISG